MKKQDRLRLGRLGDRNDALISKWWTDGEERGTVYLSKYTRTAKATSSKRVDHMAVTVKVIDRMAA